jgi:hypothetical protein
LSFERPALSRLIEALPGPKADGSSLKAASKQLTLPTRGVKIVPCSPD